jgi:K(+)-stimulated pyrophosphate-energized sodium pump
MVVRTDDREDPRSALTRGLYVTALLHAVGFAGAAKWLLDAYWVRFLGCGALGTGCALALLQLTHYYTDHRYRPVRDLAEGTRGGPTLAVLLGLSAGIEATVVIVGLLIVVLGLSFYLGAGTGLVHGGLYGSAVTTMAVLGPAAFILATDAFGPIVDNAAGIVEITVARERPDVRGRAAVLDAVGNTVKTLTGTWAAASACLAALLLVSAFLDEARRRAGLALADVPPGPGGALVSLGPRPSLALDRPEVLIAALVGVILVLWLVFYCIVGVARPARRVMDEIRRQLKDRTNVAPITSANPVLPSQPDHPPRSRSSAAPLDFSRALADQPSAGALRFVPDHEAVLEVVSRAALRQVLLPAVVAAGTPIAFGVALRFARAEDNPLAIADSIAALVMAGTMAGVLGALLLGNAGGAWDNAKKYIATGAHGGRHLVDESGARGDNPTYAAALVGDTVGDPLKDLAGPAMHILVKLLPVVTIVFLPFFL